MATNIDHHSGLVHRNADRAFSRPRLRIDSRVAALPAEEAKQRPAPSSPQAIEAGDIFHDSLIESGGNYDGEIPGWQLDRWAYSCSSYWR